MKFLKIFEILFCDMYNKNMKRLLAFLLTGVLYSQWSQDPYTPTTIVRSAGLKQSIYPLFTGDGWIVVYSNTIYDEGDIHAQKVSLDGYILWDSGGVVVSDNYLNEFDPMVCGDGKGGVIVVWNASDKPPSVESTCVFAQRIDRYGQKRWGINGIRLTEYGWGSFSRSKIVPDGKGGAIICWTDYRTGYSKTFAQRIDSMGNKLWGEWGIDVAPALDISAGPEVVVQGRNGKTFIFYMNHYVQILDNAGNRLLGDSGRFYTNKYTAYAVKDFRGGVFINTIDDYDRLYAYRLDSLANPLFPDTGILVCRRIDGGPWMREDGLGGGLLAWMDTTGGVQRILFQLVDSLGNLVYDTSGVPLPDWPDGASNFIYDNNYGWHFSKIKRDTNTNRLFLYAQRISRDWQRMWDSGGVFVARGVNNITYEVSACADDRGGLALFFPYDLNLSLKGMYINSDGELGGPYIGIKEKIKISDFGIRNWDLKNYKIFDITGRRVKKLKDMRIYFLKKKNKRIKFIFLRGGKR